MKRACLYAAAVLLALPQGSRAQETRATTELFLQKARVVRTKAAPDGVTKPIKLYLKRNGREMTAIFKDVDTWMDAASSYNGEPSDFYIDSYKCEIAAYELDKAFGFNLLPVIVERKVKRKTGSVRVWVDDVMPRFTPHRGIPSAVDVERWTHTVWLLDYLIYNVDRGTHNIMVGSDWAPVVIDNSMCFNTYVQLIRPLHRFPRGVIDKMRLTDRDRIEEIVSPWLRPAQTEALWSRVQVVLSRVDSLVALRGEEAVFLDSSARPRSGRGESTP